MSDAAAIAAAAAIFSSSRKSYSGEDSGSGPLLTTRSSVLAHNLGSVGSRNSMNRGSEAERESVKLYADPHVPHAPVTPPSRRPSSSKKKSIRASIMAPGSSLETDMLVATFPPEAQNIILGTLHGVQNKVK